MKANKLCGLLVVGTLALFTVSCREENRKDDDGYSTARRDDRDNRDFKVVSYTSTTSSGRQMLIGEDGDKVWKAREDLNDTGVDEALERDGEFHFYSNNAFSVIDKEGSRTGTWAYNGATLTVTYSGGSSYSYAVRELTNNRMRLGAYDGSELVLVDKDFRY